MKPTVLIHDVFPFEDNMNSGSAELKAIVNIELPDLSLQITGFQLIRYRASRQWAICSPGARSKNGNRVVFMRMNGDLAPAILRAALPIYRKKLAEQQAAA